MRHNRVARVYGRGTKRAAVSSARHAGSSASRLPGLARAAAGADRAADRRAVHHRPPPLLERSARVAEVAA